MLIHIILVVKQVYLEIAIVVVQVVLVHLELTIFNYMDPIVPLLMVVFKMVLLTAVMVDIQAILVVFKTIQGIIELGLMQ